MPTTASRQLVQILLLFAAVTGALLAGAAPASAHAALTGSDPKQGAVVEQAPEKVTLQFSEEVAISDDSIRVLDPDGKRVDSGELQDLCGGSVIKYGVPLRDGLADGTYTVSWKAVSADSHPVSGAFSFSIGAPSETSVAVPDQEVGGGLVGALYGIARYLSYAGFVVLVGGAAFVLGCWPRGAGARPLQRLVVYGWLTLTSATLALLLLRAPYTDSGRLADAFDLGAIGEVLQTKTGAALVSRLLLLAAAALFVAVLFGAYAQREAAGDGAEDAAEKAADQAGAEKKDLTYGLAIGGTVVAAGLASTWALAEHASTGIQTAIAMPVDVLHLLAMAAWLGGLAALLVALHRAPSLGPLGPIGRAAVRRFSGVAFWSVAVLAVTGVYQSWRQVGSWHALFSTAYGQLLMVKLGLVAVLLGVAWISRRWTGRLADGVSTEAAAADSVTTEAAAADSVTTEAAAADSVTTEEAARTEETEETVITDEAVSSPGETVSTEEETEAPDPQRAAQLARQRAVLAKAREQRARDADPDRAGLRRSVLTEAAVAVVLLAVTTALTATEPARTQERVDRASAATGTAVPDRPVDFRLPFDTGGQDGKGTVRIHLDPGRTGANTLHLWAERPDGKAFDLPEIKAALTLKAKDIGPLPVTPDRIAAGHWSASGVQVPMAGDWQLKVTVRTSDIDQVTVTKNVKIG
ncbi:copper resistance CopC/CopD family protein [Streptomyces sp. NPDC002851]